MSLRTYAICEQHFRYELVNLKRMNLATISVVSKKNHILMIYTKIVSTLF